MKSIRHLTVEIDDGSLMNEATVSGFSFGDTTFRADGVSIGRDYLRLEGTTVTRGELLPDTLTLQEIIGRGAFSVVQRA